MTGSVRGHELQTGPRRTRRTVARARSEARTEAGDSLIELVVTVAVIGVSVVGLLTALLTQFQSSNSSRTQVVADQVLSRYAETLSGVPYERCGTGDYSDVAQAAIPSTQLPPGVSVGPPGSGASINDFELSIASVAYWDGVAPTDINSPAANFTASCAGGVDHGTQRLTLQVRVGDGSFTRTLALHKLDSGR